MKLRKFIIAAALTASGAANAADIEINTDITNSVTWTADNVYNLTEQVFVRPGATLTIEAGTRIASDSGSLAVSRGARIYVNGTKDAPVVMTSVNDDGTARVACNEWGNLTIMGRGLIAASSDSERTREGNTKTPTGLNVVQMEGLTADGINDVKYGGAFDNDDSGSIKYLSIRYGGKVIGMNNELNGLSMGAVGRETDVDYVEIFNNVDDGIETWGGAVNYKHIAIWNVGDDSFDIDQGWRGKAQFGLIVQGFSAVAKQGSGVGDNCFEHDGAENSDASPATTGKIANFTVVGQPACGDGATVWRDNCRMQYHNCIFMNIGEEIVRNDGDDGDGADGYGTNGVPTLAEVWASPYTAYYTNNFVSDVYSFVEDMYPAQTSGNLAEIRRSVFFGNAVDSGDMATEFGVYDAAMSNVVSTLSPVAGLIRGSVTNVVADKTYVVYPVASIDPRASGDAVNVGGGVDADDFFTSVNYAGGFSPDYNWLEGWTAAAEYGLTDSSANSSVDTATEIAMGAVVSFQTVEGVEYSIQRSAAVDGEFAEVATVEGDGSVMTYVDDALSTSAFYRVVLK